MTERRRFLRFQTALNALCDIVSEKHKASYKIKNISKEGALVVLDKRLGQGSELHMSMDVPGDNMPVFASCEVAWQKGPINDASYETGVKFIKINSLDRSRLLEYIYLQWLKLLDKK